MILILLVLDPADQISTFHLSGWWQSLFYYHHLPRTFPRDYTDGRLHLDVYQFTVFFAPLAPHLRLFIYRAVRLQVHLAARGLLLLRPLIFAPIVEAPPVPPLHALQHARERDHAHQRPRARERDQPAGRRRAELHDERDPHWRKPALLTRLRLLR